MLLSASLQIEGLKTRTCHARLDDGTVSWLAFVSHQSFCQKGITSDCLELALRAVIELHHRYGEGCPPLGGAA